MLHRATPKHAAPRPRRSLSKKRKYLLIGAIIPLLMGGAAFAYFNLSQGTSYVKVATPANLFVTLAAPTGPALAPGSGTEQVGFAIVNQQNTTQTITTETYALATDIAGGVFDTISNAYVNSCQASWFTITGTPGPGVTLPTNLTPGAGLYAGMTTITMPADPTDNQTSCEGLQPQVVVSVS